MIPVGAEIQGIYVWGWGLDPGPAVRRLSIPGVGAAAEKICFPGSGQRIPTAAVSREVQRGYRLFPDIRGCGQVFAQEIGD